MSTNDFLCVGNFVKSSVIDDYRKIDLKPDPERLFNLEHIYDADFLFKKHKVDSFCELFELGYDAVSYLKTRCEEIRQDAEHFERFVESYSDGVIRVRDDYEEQVEYNKSFYYDLYVINLEEYIKSRDWNVYSDWTPDSDLTSDEVDDAVRLDIINFVKDKLVCDTLENQEKLIDLLNYLKKDSKLKLLSFSEYKQGNKYFSQEGYCIYIFSNYNLKKIYDLNLLLKRLGCFSLMSLLQNGYDVFDYLDRLETKIMEPYHEYLEYLHEIENYFYSQLEEMYKIYKENFNSRCLEFKDFYKYDEMKEQEEYMQRFYSSLSKEEQEEFDKEQMGYYDRDYEDDRFSTSPFDGGLYYGGCYIGT